MPRNDDYLRALQESDLSMRAGNIDSRNFFLIHGTADKMVHEQHSLMLARALIEQGVGFRHQVHEHNFAVMHCARVSIDYIFRFTQMKVITCRVFYIICLKRLNGSLTRVLVHLRMVNGILLDSFHLNNKNYINHNKFSLSALTR